MVDKSSSRPYTGNRTSPKLYYMVGNAGNGSGTRPTFIVNNTGVQITLPKTSNSLVVGVPQGTPGAATGFQYGYSVVQTGYPVDKSGRDDIFRGEAIYRATLYVTEGSGSSGVDTVYRVGTGGVLPTAATSLPTDEQFYGLASSGYAKVFRGVAFTPYP